MTNYFAGLRVTIINAEQYTNTSDTKFSKVLPAYREGYYMNSNAKHTYISKGPIGSYNFSETGGIGGKGGYI